MNQVGQEYKGHRIELREREDGPQLMIDDVPVRHGQLPNGKYFLEEYAFDWTDDLAELARRLIDHRTRVEKIQRKRGSRPEGS